MPHNEKFSHLVALLSLSIILALAGCGGGGGGSVDSPTVTAAAVPADAASTPDADSGPPAPDRVVADKQITEAPAGMADGATSATAPVADVSLPSTPAPALAEVIAEPAPMATALAARTATPEATAAVTNPSLDIFVATNGNDTWSGLVATANAGLTDGPVRTITAAQVIARQRLAAMAAGATRQPINVRIGAGEYRLTAPLTFGPTDSGVPGAAVVYRAETAGSVAISGALRVGTSSAVASGTLLTFSAPILDPSNMRGGTQLYVNSRRATLARSPNAGSFWFVQKPVALADEPIATQGQEAFVPPVEALALINGLSPAERSQAIVNVMQSWTSGWHRVSSLTTPAGVLRVSPLGRWPFLSHGTDQRFYVENVSAALDAPGEWVWNTNSLRYITAAADVGQTLALDMPVLDKLLVIGGNAYAGTFVQDLEFRGLNFGYTRQLTPDAGVTDQQAGVAIGAAIEVDVARRIVIDSCQINHTGGYGVWLRSKVRESTVSNCRMADLGAGGVKLGLAAQVATDIFPTGLNTVRANSITDTGKVLPGAVGVWIGQSSDNTVANNLIANTSYSGISVGWSWNYGSGNASRNVIANNLLVNIGQGQLSDMSGIYTVGDAPGTVISGNVIHQVRPYTGYGAGAWGLYSDAAATGILWERNIVIGTNDGGYLLHYGRSNTVRNNVLAFGDRAEVYVGKTDPALTKLVFDKNLLIPKSASPFAGFATAPDAIFTGNLVSSQMLAKAADITKCGAGCVASSATLTVGTDPRVVAVLGGDAIANAWVSTVAASAGPLGLAASAIPSVVAVLPPVVVAPPVGYSTDIGTTAIGARPLNMRYIVGKVNSSITVQSATGTSTGKALVFADSAAVGNSWEPYSWATLNHTKGTTKVEFSIKMDAATNFQHEWRDNASVFQTGPSLRIKPTGIDVAGKIVAPAPIGQWLTVRITVPLDTAAGLWTLETSANGTTFTKVGTYANKSAGWKTLSWLGFISNATVTSTTLLGYVKADNTAP